MDAFALIQEEVAPYMTGSRTESAALLAWFLNVVWRLAPEDVDDAICDGGGDKGIDALVVDDELSEITIFQSKHRQTAAGGQGDLDLRSLVGASAYFESPESVDGLLASQPNKELRQLLQRLDIRTKVADGAHATRVVFVTNGLLNDVGRGYADAIANRQPTLDIWDRDRLAPLAQSTRRPELRPDAVTLTASSMPGVLQVDAQTTIAVALVDAADLVVLPGIDDLTLFGRNVRLELGRTRINRELSETLRDRAEHSMFPAYHNGLTILTHGVTVDGNQLRLDGITVVNGCQSLLALYRNRSQLTSQVKVLVKVVAVDPHSDLSDKITYRTNNQNPVNLRDQRSTDPIQRHLQTEMQTHYGTELAYGIRAGETFNVPELDNQLAAQLVTAVYLQEPWAAVRRIRLFDDDYRRIFSRALTAHRLYFLYRLNQTIDALRSELRPDLAASFASVRFTIIYLAAEVLCLTEEGKALVDTPERWLPDAREEVDRRIKDLVRDLIQSVNFYIKAREDEALEQGNPETFDPKVVFKSKTGVGQVENDIIRDARRHALREQARGEEYLFQIPPIR